MRWGAPGLAALAILIMAGYQYGWERGQVAKLPLSVTARVQRLIPPGACLLADEMSFAVMTNRLTSDVPGCSLLLDTTGTNYALSHGRDPETGAARYARLDAVWTYAFDHAQYVWLSGRNKAPRGLNAPAHELLQYPLHPHHARRPPGIAVPAHRPEASQVTPATFPRATGWWAPRCH